MLYRSLNRSLILLPVLAVVAIASACQQQNSEHHDSFLVFGTIINVTLLDVDDKTAEKSFRRIRED